MHRARAPIWGYPIPSRLCKLVARLHPHSVIGGAPTKVLQCERHVCRHTRIAVQQVQQRSALAPETRSRLDHDSAHIAHAVAD